MSASNKRVFRLAAIATMLLAVSACGGDAPSQEAEPSTLESSARQTSAASSASPSATKNRQPKPSTKANPSPAPTFDGTVVEVDVLDDGIRTPEERVVVALNSQVRLVVASDISDEVHVHGVDKYVDLTPAKPVTFDFTASIPGTFEVELHDAGDLLFTLQVEP
jgi:hypothetical protein